MPSQWSDTVTVVDLAETDIPAVAAIERQEPSSWSELQIREELSGINRVALVACDSGNIVGWCCCRWCGEEAELLKIVVVALSRRRGIGSTLLETAFHRLEDMGVGLIFLEVRAANSQAVMFYRNLGWKVAGRRSGYYRNPDDDAVIMSRKLR